MLVAFQCLNLRVAEQAHVVPLLNGLDDGRIVQDSLDLRVGLEVRDRLHGRRILHHARLQLLEAEAERDLAAGRADEARANVQLAELALQQTKLYAPISGIISRPLVHEGTYITKETRDQSRLATIVQLARISHTPRFFKPGFGGGRAF